MPAKRWVPASTVVWKLSPERALLLEAASDRREVVVAEHFAQQLPVGCRARLGREAQ